MTVIRVVNRTKGTELGGSIRLAETILRRLRGFLFRGRPSAGEGILLSPCRGVHMIGVTFPLDVLFIDDGGRVVAMYEGLRPMRRTRIHGTASHALELPPGTIETSATEIGDALLWSPVDAHDAFLEKAMPQEPARAEPREVRKQA